MISRIPEEQVEVEGKEKEDSSKENNVFAWVRGWFGFSPISVPRYKTDLHRSAYGRHTKELQLRFSCLYLSEIIKSFHLQRQHTDKQLEGLKQSCLLTCTVMRIIVLSCRSAF